ncbi:MAG: GNAT family N-acetyltransferase, partial [Bryobacteraceae bacterium]|nr:GNAT family N-acetyltransferase [Bryobacteraceae bacterium]
EILIRPIRPEDEPLMVAFHESLSDRTVYQRYLQVLKLEQRVMHERLTRICFNDYDRELALVAELTDFVTGAKRILAVGRLQKLRGLNEAEIAVVVADAYQGLGVGAEILRRLVGIARVEKVDRLWADILADNRKMQRLCESIGFKLESELGDPTVSGYLDLRSAERP